MHLASPGLGERAICTTQQNKEKHKQLILKVILAISFLAHRLRYTC
jgi:hypothetical protein